MTKFDVNKYNNKIELLDEIIDTLNYAIRTFYDLGYEVSSELIKDMINNPTELCHKYLNYEKLAQRKCAKHGITDKELHTPGYADGFYEIIDEMRELYEALTEVNKLYPFTEKAFGTQFYIKKERDTNDNSIKLKAVKTRNALLYIMLQCGEYSKVEYSDLDFEV